MPKFEGTVEEIVFRNDQNGWTVAAFRLDGSGRTSAVGILPFLAPGEHVILDGELVQHREYGEQIRVHSYETSRPATRSAVEKYLGSGLIKGLGPATARNIVEHFGVEALDILESQPQRLTELSGIGPKKAAIIAESFAMQNEMRGTLIFLQGVGLTPALAVKVYKAFGDQSEVVLRRNPYRLADEIEGIGFQTADRIAQSMGFVPETPERLISGIQFVLSEASASMGHVFLPEDALIQRAAAMLGVGADLVAHTLECMLMETRLVREELDGTQAVYLSGLHRVECETARLLLQWRSAPCRICLPAQMAEAEIARYEARTGVVLCDCQRQAVAAAAAGGLTVITGGPGTGKTTSINCILYLLERCGQVELCAPTGRAAKRMSEATGRVARTLHRLLEYSGETGGFQRDEDNPVEADVVVVDEMSMVDIFLMRSLLRALRPGTKLILVGDADQLPSVGAGNVLRDMIDSGAVPVARLDEIFRQSARSHIVVNAHRINRGEYPLIRNRDTDFFLERRESAAAIVESVVNLVQRRLPGYLGLDSLRGIQVMAPMKKGALGVYQLNAALQAALNPPSGAKAQINRGDCIFRMGDKVMQVRNNYELEWTRDSERGEGVFNGDIGYIVEMNAAEREMLVEFDDGRRAVYDDSMLDELELSYCISVHKSQGSEFDAVVLPLLTGPQMLMTRNLLYTAVTRARRLVVVVGREDCMRRMVDNNRIQRRYSALGMRLRRMAP